MRRSPQATRPSHPYPARAREVFAAPWEGSVSIENPLMTLPEETERPSVTSCRCAPPTTAMRGAALPSHRAAERPSAAVQRLRERTCRSRSAGVGAVTRGARDLVRLGPRVKTDFAARPRPLAVALMGAVSGVSRPRERRVDAPRWARSAAAVRTTGRGRPCGGINGLPARHHARLDEKSTMRRALRGS